VPGEARLDLVRGEDGGDRQCDRSAECEEAPTDKAVLAGDEAGDHVELGTLRSAASVSLRFSAARSNSDVSRAATSPKYVTPFEARCA